MAEFEVVRAPEKFNFATDVVDRWAADPLKTALVWVDAEGRNESRLSFDGIRTASIRLAAGLQGSGLKRGDRVLVAIGREPSWWVAMIALIRAGLVAVPGTTLLTPKDLKFRIELGKVRGAIVDAPGAEKIDTVRESCPGLQSFFIADGQRAGWSEFTAAPGEGEDVPEFDNVETLADEPCLIFFTSGTTGRPKMVLHTHASYPLGHKTTGQLWLDLGPEDLHWNLSDTGWAKAAWSSLFGPWIQGAAVFVQQPTAKFDPQSTLQTLSKFPITTFCAPPTVYRSLVTLDLEATPARALRHAVAAGEPLNPEVIARWKDATGVTIRDGYGQTETTILAGNFLGREVRPGSMGVSAPGYNIEIVDDDLRPLPANAEGDIAVRVKPERPLGLFVEYLDNETENAAKFRGDFYLTGDRAYRDEAGYLWFVGRSDDIILSAGYRIGPFEVESALLEHPAVLEAAVVGVPDPERYQIVKAFIVLNDGFKASDELARELQNHVKQATAPYKYPRVVEFAESLPKTISGKIRRIQLRESAGS